MRDVVRLGAGACGLLVALAACGSPPTQLVVVVDTDLDLGREVDRVAVSVTGPSGTTETEEAALRASEAAALPLTLGVTPSGDSLGPITVRAIASLAGTEVVSREHRVTLVRGESRVLVLHLARACASRGPCPTGHTCGEQGCASIEIAPEDLPRWNGEPPRLREDAGAPSDASTPFDASAPADASAPPDAGAPPDASPPSDGAMPDAGAGECARDSDCDDGEVCTADSCDDGVCVNVPADGTACDDGEFCNGLDTCMGGACVVHAGPPCVGSTVCDEENDRCTGCVTDEHCPAPSTGAWGACEYESPCAEAGSRSRVSRSFTCEAGACVPSDHTETAACTRSTEGDSCAATTCSPTWGACGGFAGMCGETGTQSRTCNASECRSGLCKARTFSESRPCSRDVDGEGCGDDDCGAWSQCTYASPCAQSGTRSRTCRPRVCGGGSCGLGAQFTQTETCGIRITEGDTCGLRTCSNWGPCSALGSCTGQRMRSCTDQVCAAGVCTGKPVTEFGICTALDGTPCGSGCECHGGVCGSRDGEYLCLES